MPEPEAETTTFEEKRMFHNKISSPENSLTNNNLKHSNA